MGVEKISNRSGTTLMSAGIRSEDGLTHWILVKRACIPIPHSEWSPMEYRRIIALIMVCSCLLLPLGSFALPQTPPIPNLHGTESISQFAAPKAPALPGDGSDQLWCDDDCDSDADCDFGDDIPCFKPALAAIAYLPTATPMSAIEPLQRFPRVYLPIFVPPPSRS